MLKTIFKVLFKILLALGVVFAAAAALKYFEEQQVDYVEIYNDDMDGEYY